MLDSSAFVALVRSEPGADVVRTMMDDCVVSAVNFAEIVDVLSRKGVGHSEVRQTVDSLGLEIVPFDRQMAMRAGELAVTTKRFGLSLGDRACVALAERMNCDVVTADRRWKDAVLPVGVTLIR